jgi:hypothetical protein
VLFDPLDRVQRGVVAQHVQAAEARDRGVDAESRTFRRTGVTGEEADIPAG